MTVRELYKKYKGYQIMLFGTPLKEKQSVTPFTRLPKDKNMYDCEVVELEIDDEEQIGYVFDLNLRFKRIEKDKGTVYAYIR